MKKIVMTIILGVTSSAVIGVDAHQGIQQPSVMGDRLDDVCGQDLFESDQQLLEPFEELVIPATKRSFSFKNIGMYLKLASSYCYNDGIKPAYYAVLGYVKGSKKK